MQPPDAGAMGQPDAGRTGRTGRLGLAALGDPAVLPDPYPVLAGLREASPFPRPAARWWWSAVTRTAPASCATRGPAASGTGHTLRTYNQDRGAIGRGRKQEAYD
jgi:hypothetical protein